MHSSGVHERSSASAGAERTRKKVQELIQKAPRKVRAAVTSAVEKLDRARTEEIRTLRQDLDLYRTLGTVGTTAAVFAHDAAKPVTQIEQLAGALEIRGQELLGAKYASTFSEPLRLIKRSVRALRSYASLPIALLRREKRKVGPIAVNTVVSDIAELFRPFLDEAEISLRLRLSDVPGTVRGSVASIEAIVANLVTNSINAVVRNPETTAGLGERIIEIRTDSSPESVTLQVLDSGPGIVGIRKEDIWLPGYTTTPGGTGLGLTIVRDAVVDLGGEVQAVAHGELGGAEFLVSLPAYVEQKT